MLPVVNFHDNIFHTFSCWQLGAFWRIQKEVHKRKTDFKVLQHYARLAASYWSLFGAYAQCQHGDCLANGFIFGFGYFRGSEKTFCSKISQH